MNRLRARADGWRGGIVAITVVGLAAGCVGGSDNASPAAPAVSGESAIVESSTPVRPPLDLGERDPESVFVGADLVFGQPDAGTLLAVEGLVSDPLVEAAVAREVFSAQTGEHVATVTSVELVPAVFTTESAADGYASGLAAGVSGADEPPSIVALGSVDGFVATGDQRSLVTFRMENVIVVVDAVEQTEASGVAASIADAAAAGAVAAAPTTPFAAIDQQSVFVPLTGFVFEPLPPPDDPSDLAYQPMEAPVLDGLAGFPDGRFVVIGNEIRGTAWVLPVSPEAYGSAEALIEPMRVLAQARSGGEVTETVVAGRTVFAGDTANSVRVFREENLVLVVDGLDALAADAIAAEWSRAIGRP